MKSKQLLELIQRKSITVPLFLYPMYKTLDIDLASFLFLMYLMQLEEPIPLDTEKMSKDFSCDKESIMEWFTTLLEKGLLSMEVRKNESGKIEEGVSLQPFYHKVLKYLVEELNDEEQSSTIYEVIQKEFGRMLSPMEYEIIGAWIDSNIKEELILEAVKEAIFNGVTNLRYIDKILYEWGKKGYKTKEDVEKQRAKRKAELEKEPREKKEIFDYNWLEEEDDE